MYVVLFFVYNEIKKLNYAAIVKKMILFFLFFFLGFLFFFFNFTTEV